jgi:molecular chaperone GrpE (heat shock protein)
MSRERSNIPNDERTEWRMPSGESQDDTTRSFETEEQQDAAPARREETPASAGAAYLPHEISSDADERWQRIQAEFVDDPRRSVTGAHELVSELVQRVVETFTDERDTLERQWSEGDRVSTEDLRICMQRYRAFFSRLLPLNDRTGIH